MQQLTNIASSIVTFINVVAVPLIFAVAFIVFLFGVFRYYIAGGANPEKRKEGTQLIVYALIGFAVMIVVWGLVNVIIGTLGITNNNRPNLPTFGNTGSGNGSTRAPTQAPVPNQGAQTQGQSTQNPTVQTSPVDTTSLNQGHFIGPRP